MLVYNMPKPNSGGVFMGGVKPHVPMTKDPVKADDPTLLSNFSLLIKKFLPIPGLSDILGSLVNLLDGCPDFDKEKVYAEETEKAQVWIMHFKNILKDEKFGKTQAERMTRADRYYTYVTNHHIMRKNSVACGVNKYAESVKSAIALKFLNKYRHQFSQIATPTKKIETYFEPLKAGDRMTLDYNVWTLKPNANNILHSKVHSVKNDVTTTNTSTGSTSTDSVITNLIPVPSDTIDTPNNSNTSTGTKDKNDSLFMLIAAILLVFFGVAFPIYLIYKFFTKKKKRK